MNVKNFDPETLYGSDGVVVNLEDETVVAEMKRRGVFDTFQEQASRMIAETGDDCTKPMVVVMKARHEDRLNYYAFHYGNADAKDNGPGAWFAAGKEIKRVRTHCAVNHNFA